MRLGPRIRQLERQATGAAALHVVLTYEGETEAEALRRAAIAPSPTDLVVFLRKFTSKRQARTA
ncbi:MAG: hypothetical protein FJX60_02260 [Alphaproteobacteria bacterium]|nr:hypothetical protein [Alphaproteobacteria bacterium]